MDREIVEKKVEALEKRVRWQMRAIIGLIIVFLFNTSPAFTSKWFHPLIPSKLTSVNLSSDKSTGDTDFRNIASHREEILASRRIQGKKFGQRDRKIDFLSDPSRQAEMLSQQLQTPRLGKQVQAGELQVVSDTLRVRTLLVNTLQVVNAQGNLVALIGSNETTGNGFAGLLNTSGSISVILGTDENGNGLAGIRNASNSAGIALGIGRGNGVVGITNADGVPVAAMLADETENGVVTIIKNESPIASLEVDTEGNGTVGTASASGSSFAFLGADESGNAGMVVGTVSESSAGAVILGVDDVGNGSVSAVSASGSIVDLGIDAAGDAAVLLTNREGILASVLGVDENGHGVMGILNASGRPIAAMAADEAGNGVLGIEGGKFRAYIDSAGNGVAETRGQNQILRWSSEITPTGGGGTPSGLIGDLDQDGDVDFNDFLIFTSNFGKTSG